MQRFSQKLNENMIINPFIIKGKIPEAYFCDRDVETSVLTNVEAILRTHIQHCTNADFVFAGSERHILSEMFNAPSCPFYASTTSMSLDAISMDMYAEFVTTNFEEFDKDIESEWDFCNRLSLLSQKPKEVLFAIAREGKSQKVTSAEFIRKHKLLSASSVQSAIKQLLDEDWITYSVNSNGRKQYSLSDTFLSLWIKQHYC